MKKISSIMTLLVMALMGLSLAACSEDALDTNQYQGGVSLNAYGPNPVMRGGLLRFVGSNLDQIASVTIPGCSEITNYTIVKSGVPSEISVTVPKDGPVEGIITLKAKDGSELKTQTALTFTEPIVFDEFTPASVMPGETLTIKGDYLNLVHLVAFTGEEVYVSEDDFISHDRYTITLKVPEEARTGRVSLYTEDITKKVYDEEGKLVDVSYNIIESDEALTVGTPVIAKFASPRGQADALGTVVIKQNETLTITGEYLQLAQAVVFSSEMGSAVINEFNVSDDGKTLTLVLPPYAPDGDVNVQTRSEVQVPVGTIETVKPTNLKAAPAPVKNGAALTISGNDLDVVTTLNFPNVADAVEFTYADNKITVTVPELAQEGDITLGMANGASVAVAYTLVKPAVTGYNPSPVSAGGALTIQGTNLDLVKAVKFGESDEAEATPAADGNSLTLSVPMNAQSGKPTLLLKNDATVEASEITIEEAVFCYITELPNDETKPDAGSVCTVPVKNGDKLTGVTVNGTSVQFVYDAKAEKLTFGIPTETGATAALKLISSNGEIEYELPVKPATQRERVVFTGPIEVDWNATWPEGRIFITWDQLKDIPEDAVMHIEFTQHEAWGQVQINYGDWSQIPFEGTVDKSGFLKPEIWNDKSVKEIDLPFTQEILNNIQAKNSDNGAILIQGEHWTINKISIKWEVSMETEIWSEGPLDLSGGAQPYIGSDGGTEFAKVKAGQVVRFYIEPTEAGWYFEVFEGHWGPKYAAFNGENSGISYGSSGFVELTLTNEIIAAAKTSGGWGGIFIVQGKVILHKVTIE